MADLSPATKAGIAAGAVSLLLVLGALYFQFVVGLAPCQMCYWQRWPHWAAAGLGLGGGALAVTGVLPRSGANGAAVLAIFALALSGAIGVYHAGVEWQWWLGPTSCSGTGFVPGGPDAFRIARCDVAPWEFLGLSLAGYNALISLGMAAIFAVLGRRKD
jgi:disulfide bond formation protein DsbB